MAEAPRSGTGGAAAANAMADDWPEIPDEITEDNPLFLRPLSEDLLHFKIISEKFNEVRIRLVSGLQAERARCADLERRLEQAVEAEEFATRSMKKALVDAKDYLLLSRLCDHFRKENGELKEEIKELKNRASVEADVAATRQAAWEREAQEAQRALELERQAVREQAKEARELADRERSALQEAARKSAEEMQRRHEEEVTALRDEIKSVREECTEEVNLATLEFEDRSAQHTERVTTLETEILSLQEQLSAATGHIGYMESRVADLQAERGRLQEVNRGLMLQQQRQAAQAAQTPRAPSKSRALNTPAPPGFQLASAVYAPPRPPPPASTASQSATPYPQLPVAWWNKAGASTQFDAGPPDADPPSGTLDLPASPPMPKQRRGRRKLFEDVDFVMPPLPERRPLTSPTASTVPTLAEKRLPTTSASSGSLLAERRPSTTLATSTVLTPTESQPSTTPATSTLPVLTTPSAGPPGQPSGPTADKLRAPGKFNFKRKTVVGSFSSRGEGLSATPTAALRLPAVTPATSEAEAEETAALPALSSRTVAASGSSSHGDCKMDSRPVEVNIPTAPKETPKQPTSDVFFFQGLASDVQRKPPQQAKGAPKPQAVGKEKQDRPGPLTAAPTAAKALKQKTIPDSFLQYLSKLPATKARWSVPADPAPAAQVQMQTPARPAQAEPTAAECRPDREDTRLFFQRQLQLQTPAPEAIALTASELESATPTDPAKHAPCESSSAACTSTSTRVDAVPAPADDQLQQSAVTACAAAPTALRQGPTLNVKTAAVQQPVVAPPAPVVQHQRQASPRAVTLAQLPASAPVDQVQQRASLPTVTLAELPVDAPAAPTGRLQQSAVILPAVAPAQLPADAAEAQCGATCPAAASAGRQQSLDAAAADKVEAAPQQIDKERGAPAGALTSPSELPSEPKQQQQPKAVAVDCEPPGTQAWVEVTDEDFPLTQRVHQPSQDEEHCFTSLSLADVSLDTDLSLSTICATQQVEPSTSEVQPAASRSPAAGAMLTKSTQAANGGGPETSRPEATLGKSMLTPEGSRATEPDLVEAAPTTPQSRGVADEQGLGALDEVDQDAPTPKLPTALEPCALVSVAAQAQEASVAPKALPPSSPAEVSSTIVVLEPKPIQDAAPSLPSLNPEHVAKMTEQESVQHVASAASANLWQQQRLEEGNPGQHSSPSAGLRALMVCSPLAAAAASGAGDAEVVVRRDPERFAAFGIRKLQPLFSSPPSPASAAILLGKPLAALQLDGYGAVSSERDDNKIPVVDEAPGGGLDSAQQGQLEEVHALLAELMGQNTEVGGQLQDLLDQPKEVHGHVDALQDALSQPTTEAAAAKEVANAASAASATGQATPRVDCSSSATTSGGSGGAESISYSPLSEIDDGDGEQQEEEDADEATTADGQQDCARSSLLKGACSGQSNNSLEGEAGEACATLTQRSTSSARRKWRPPVLAGPGLALLQEAYEIGCSQQGSGGRRSNGPSSSPSSEAAPALAPAPSSTKDSSDGKKRGPSPTELAEPTACEPTADAAEPGARPGPSGPEGGTATKTTATTPQRPKRDRTSKKRRLLDALDTFEF